MTHKPTICIECEHHKWSDPINRIPSDWYHHLCTACIVEAAHRDYVSGEWVRVRYAYCREVNGIGYCSAYQPKESP